MTEIKFQIFTVKKCNGSQFVDLFRKMFHKVYHVEKSPEGNNGYYEIYVFESEVDKHKWKQEHEHYRW